MTAAHSSSAQFSSGPAPGDGPWLVFVLDEHRYALALRCVERVVRAAAITPLPQPPGCVFGALDVAGSVLPVFDLRQRFALPPRRIAPADHFLIAQARQRRVVLPVDRTEGLVDGDARCAVESEQLAAQLRHIRGILQLPDGLILIQDLDAFLSDEEMSELEQSLQRGARA